MSNDNRCILWKNIKQCSNPSWHKQPVYRCPPSADGYSPTKRKCGKWAYLHRPRFCHPWLSDTFARNTASTSIEPHKSKKNEKIRKEQTGEERNRTPFLFFVVPLSSETVILPLAKLTGTGHQGAENPATDGPDTRHQEHGNAKKQRGIASRIKYRQTPT